MRAEPAVVAVHATAVAIDGRALLIHGPSRSGKSRLALALIAASTRSRRIRLIGDDRILLTREDGVVVARPHPRIAGFIERRGLGIVAMANLAAAPVGAIVELGRAAALPCFAGENFPVLSFVTDSEAGERDDRVLRWWADVQTANSQANPLTAECSTAGLQTAACAQHPPAKAACGGQTSGKD